VGKIGKKTSEGVRFLLMRSSNYDAILSKIHSYRLLFWAIFGLRDLLI